MTENEALNVLKMIEAHGCLAIEAKEVAIQALEEIQQYRAIGRVEEVKYLVDSYNDMMHDFGDNMLALEQYKAIGTVKEFKDLKEKNVSKKPRFYAHNYYCTECGNLLGNNEFEWQRFLYCDKCGQKLDYGAEGEEHE